MDNIQWDDYNKSIHKYYNYSLNVFQDFHKKAYLDIYCNREGIYYKDVV